MHLSRRTFLGSALAAGVAREVTARHEPPNTPGQDRFDPWVEVDAEALRFNVAQLRALTGGRPILAVVKNNAYGLDLVQTSKILATLPEVAGFAVVKTHSAITLRDAGIEKPILLMGMCSEADGHELVSRGIEISLYTDDAAERITALAGRTQRPVRAHFYLDTGLGRMGMPYHRALPWLADLSSRQELQVAGTFMGFTEETDFDREQLVRFRNLAQRARDAGADLGQLHAASSNGVYHLPDSHLDLVRPGIALYGCYPSRYEEERAKQELRPAVRLRARVVRVVRLRPGDSVGYGSKYTAVQPTWLATVPAGHTDGVPRESVAGGRVLIGEHTYPVVGSVSASHCMVALSARRTASVGDPVTLIGPDHPDIHPNTIAQRTGVSVYDVLMHLNPTLPRYLV